MNKNYQITVELKHEAKNNSQKIISTPYHIHLVVPRLIIIFSQMQIIEKNSINNLH